jgi:ABC-type sugar transport system ATPase subunit
VPVVGIQPGEGADGTVAVRPPAVSFRGITKLYPGVTALQDVSFTVATGEVHALVGENGAGKSTLLKVLTGAHDATEGTIELFGEEVSLDSPKAARARGIAAVYQELTLIPALPAIANVFLGQPLRIGPLEDRGAMLTRYAELARRMGVSIPPGARADTLSVAEQQALEIMRAIQADARILALDEPTASLAVHEREALYRNIRALADRGVTVVFVSHDLGEVLSLSDTVTVFRDGRRVDTRPAASWTRRSLVEAMFGERVVTHVDRKRLPGQEVLRCSGLDMPGVLDGVELTLRRGELLGVAGLVGAGRTELLRSLAGLERAASGELWIDGKSVDWPRTPRQALALGIGLAPEDRKTQGLVLGMTVHANINMTRLSAVSTAGYLRPAQERRRAGGLARRMRLAESTLGRPARTLSGGNQQKAVLAKWLDRGLSVLLVDEPTRGIDLAAKAEVFSLLDALAAEGLGVIMVSSELEELVDHCDRVVVLARGRSVAELGAGELDEGAILRTIFEVEGEEAA